VALEVAALRAAIVSSSDSLSGAGVARGVLAEAQLEDPAQRVDQFSRASSRVRPWLSAPGTSGTDATIQPSSPCSKTIVSCSDSLTPEPYSACIWLSSPPPSRPPPAPRPKPVAPPPPPAPPRGVGIAENGGA